MITQELDGLLRRGVPKMTDEGAAKFQQMMEEAVRSVVLLAFDASETEAFHVTTMVAPMRPPV